MAHALIVDDKIKPREWAQEALRRIGFHGDNIHEAVCGDHAIEVLNALSSRGQEVDFVLSDYHMDPKRKHPEGTRKSFRNAQLRSGIDLAKKLQEIRPRKPFCLHSRGMHGKLLTDSQDAGIDLTLYKRRPEEQKFQAYCDAIKAYIKGDLTRELYQAAFPQNLSSCRGLDSIMPNVLSTKAYLPPNNKAA